MPKSISVKRKKRGRPPTGVDPLVGVRLPPQMISNIDQWAKQNNLSRSEAIRRLIERAFTAAAPSGPAKAGSRRKAADLAGQAIDSLGDQTATVEKRAHRKRRLIKGPREFRDVRGDRPKKTG
jgi:Arc/MetJ-type ribon-helix-helix transcriptional regulator